MRGWEEVLCLGARNRVTAQGARGGVWDPGSGASLPTSGQPAAVRSCFCAVQDSEILARIRAESSPSVSSPGFPLLSPTCACALGELETSGRS